MIKERKHSYLEEYIIGIMYNHDVGHVSSKELEDLIITIDKLRDKTQVLNRRLIKIRNERNKYKKMYEAAQQLLLYTLNSFEDDSV